ncbi:hypothetical protein B5P43_35355 [Bacillus sp. SRB_336]|nr:hypothetical protein B5P43_35355 [Bacillus sp. SRB_336]
MTAVGKDASGGDPAATLAAALRRLILRGEHFRNLRARELHLGSNDVLALGHLHDGGSMAPKVLSALMGVTSGTMTAMLDRVEKAGFLRREPNPDDRRALLLRLTPAGEHAMQWLDEEFDATVRETLAGLPGMTPDELHHILNELSSSLERRLVDESSTSRPELL